MLRGLFHPETVAVVGVSDSLTNMGRGIVHNLISFGFQGRFYVVGPKGGEVLGHHIYSSVTELPESIDTAIILVPAQHVPSVLVEAGQKGAKWAVISSAGFSEYDGNRETLEAQVLTIARRYGMRLVGPNCLGIINMHNGFATPFAPMDPKKLRQGTVTVIGQSGGVTQRMAALVSQYGAGLSKFVSVGNKLDLDETDYLAYFAEDEETQVICFYLEDIRRGREFVEIARRCPKPILMYKANTTPAASQIARSHTAALASDDRVVDAALRQAGVVRVQRLRHLAESTAMLRLPPLQGPNLAVVCASGGFSVVTADACHRWGFNLPSIDSEVLEDIQSRSRAGVIKLSNPLDMGDIHSLEVTLYAIRRLLELPYIDGVATMHAISISSPFALSQLGPSRSNALSPTVLHALRDMSLSLSKPIAVVSMYPEANERALAHELDFPLFEDPEDAIAAMAALRTYSEKNTHRQT